MTIFFLHRNEKFVTVQNKFSKMSPWTSLHFETCRRSSRALRPSCFPRFFMSSAAAKLRANDSSGVSSFLLWTSLFIPQHTHKKNLGEVWRYISETFQKLTRVLMKFPFFSQWPVISSSKGLAFPSKSPCTYTGFD